MTDRHRVLVGTLVVLALVGAGPEAVGAQTTPPTPAPGAPEPLPAPTGIAPFATLPGPAGREITLEDALAIAVEAQPQIRARLADYDAARQRVDQALSPLLPQVAFSWSAARTQSVGTGLLAGQERTIRSVFTSTTARLSVSQLLYDFGKNSASTEAARAQAESSREELELQKDLIILAVKEAYFNMLFGRRLVRVNEAAVERALLNLRSARGFYEVGTRPKSDVTRAEVDVANARLDLIRAQNAVRLARTALNTAMGIAVNTPTEVKDILVYERLPLDRATLVSEALRQRPEHRQAKARLGAAEAVVRQTFRSFFPDVVGSASYGLARTDFNEIWDLFVELRWSIYDGGNKVARFREAEAQLEAARARVRDTQLAIWREVEAAQLTVAEAEERIVAAEKAVESAQENFRLSQGRFDAGVGTILELTDAQLALTRAQSVAAQALADFRIAAARLERALGRR